MAQNTLGRNLTFPIYNADGTSFHNLVLHKAVVDSVVMSLGDKITGDVYYKDNALDVTMHEYIMFKRNPNDENEDAVKYVLVSPPTIVREGMVSDNSELKGMTKYSFVFYHPMYVLNNIPFTDIAVSFDEERYKSQDRSFSWIGYLNEFVNKLNKNLEGTEWIVVSNATDANTVLSDVLTFDNSTIAEALKKAYDTWGTPFIIDKIDEGEEYYSEGKRFSVLIGTPSNTITKDGSEYIFRFGQGLGLKNNTATPRNNKIITRIAGYGSEDNIPYGYPQIVWTGNSEWNYTINNTSGMQSVVVNGVTVQAMSYPIYDGIVGGQNVKLIKHPFTRTHLMPSVYVERVNKKVNPYAQDYNPDIEIIDYYDAVDEVGQEPYANKINTSAPSYEIHQFGDIKPELGSAYLAADAIPVNADQSEASGWDDTMDGDGNYSQSYFKIILPPLGFDLYACAAITQEMKIAMRGGACIGCTFIVQVNWESYKANFYDANGNFAPNGAQRNLDYFPDTTQNAVAVIVQKDLDTFGTIMPNVYQQPHAGDTFVFLGISLPLTYITNAQTRLDNEMKSYMRENNIYYFDYPLKFDEYFLAKNTDILLQIRNNSAIKFQFADTIHTLYVKQITIKYGAGTLPQYDITLTDKIEAEINKIGQMIDESVNRITTVQATFVDVPYTLTQSVRSKMSADWFQRLFVAYDANNNIVLPNDTQTEIARICALYDFYSVGGVSSLGFSSGGGGSASLNALLASLNGSTIGNVAPTISQNGKCPVWVQTTDDDGHWEWGTTGGSGTGTLPNDIAYWDDDDGTVIYVDENGNVVSLAEYAKKTWVEDKIAQIPSSSFNEAAMWTALGTNESTKIIDDLHISSTIKEGAAAGATAIQQSDLNTALSSYYTKAEANGLFVHLVGDENITGVKTFSNDIVATRIKIGNAYISYNSNGLCIDDGNGGSMNLYATGGVSALGYQSGGGGGGDDLNLLLDNINSSNIGNIAPTASEVGKCLVYNGNNTWAWATPGGGGGGLTYGLAWSYGSVASAQGNSYDGSTSQSFVIPKDTSHLTNNAGFITSSALSEYLNIGSNGVVEGGQYYDFHISGSSANYATRLQASSTYNNTLTFPSEDGVIATRNWVSQQGYQSAISDLSTIRNNASNGATAYGWGNHADAGYATEEWVNGKGYSTQAWVEAKGYATQTALAAAVTRITTMEGYFTNGVANQAARLSGTSTYRAWGQTFWQNGTPKSIGSASARANISYAGSVSMGWSLNMEYDDAVHDPSINIKSSKTGTSLSVFMLSNSATSDHSGDHLAIGWGTSAKAQLPIRFFGREFIFNYTTNTMSGGNYTTAEAMRVGYRTLDSLEEPAVYVRKHLMIGDGTGNYFPVTYNSNNNALCFSGHIYATGGISALGFSSTTNGGALINGALEVAGQATLRGNATVGGTMDVDGVMTLGNRLDFHRTVDGVNANSSIFTDTDGNLGIESYGYLSINSDIVMGDNCNIDVSKLAASEVETNSLKVGNDENAPGAVISRIYFDEGYLKVTIGNTTHKFQPVIS